MFKLCFLSTFLLAFSTAYSFDQSHSEWDQILKKYVTNDGGLSNFNYKSFVKEKDHFNKVLKSYSEVSEDEFRKWTKNQQLSFLINVYNAFTVKLVVDSYPVKSIKDLGGLFSSPWKKEFFVLFAKKRNLDWIEHEKIRPIYNEPRVHFALVCASKGCPALSSEAFVADKIDGQLENSMKRFLTEKRRNDIDHNSKTLKLSSLFKWYRKDFIKDAGTVQNFVKKYISERKDISDYDLEYLSYDWSLNE